MDLTTTARVKTYMGKSGSDLDPVIAQLVTQVSAEVEDYLDRTAQDSGSDVTEVLDVEWDGQAVYLLHAWPVASVTTIKYDVDQEFSTATALTSTQYVDLSVDSRNRGELHIKLYYERAPKALQVVYQGGMATSTSGFVLAYPDLAGAIDAQVAFLVRRRDTLGIASVSGDGGNVAHFDRMTWLPILKATARRHRRAL